MKKLLTLFLSLAALALAASPALATYNLFDNAHIVSGGNPVNAVQLVSDTNPGWGGVNFTVPVGTNLGNLNTLSTDYKITVGNCGGGAPRFVLNYDNNPNTNISIYIGPTPNFTGCTLDTWQNTTNLIGNSELRYDTSQMGGTFYDSYSHAVSLSGSHLLTGISLVVDGGWAVSGGIQTILFDNVVVNTDTYTFDPVIKKVDVCHLENKKSTNYHLINVSENAVPAHLKHGDKLQGAWIVNPLKLDVAVTYSGTWKYTANFVQTGTDLTGILADTYSGGYTGPISNGSIIGDKVIFSFDYHSPVQGIRTYVGTIQPNGDLVGKWSQTGLQSTNQQFDFTIANFLTKFTCE